MTIGEAVHLASGSLRGSSQSPRLDATLLLAEVLSCSKEQVFARLTEQISDDPLHQFRALADRRRSGTPIAYMTGRKEFFGLDFAVDPRVLIPRPESELLVRLALGLDTALTYFDLCTGSGCVAISIAVNKEDATVAAGDISADSLEVCAANALRHDVQVSLVQSDLFSSVEGRFDCITANPPYLSRAEWSEAYGERWEEPHQALVGGANGAEIIDRLVEGAADHLEVGGRLFVEAGPGQMREIGRRLSEVGFDTISCFQDLRGDDRVIGARWNT